MLTTENTARKTILVVEDNAALGEVLATRLQREACAVVLVLNGQEALDYLG